MHLIYCTYGTETGKKKATTPPEQLENTLRFSRKQNMAFEFFLSGRRKLQITHRADVIFLWAVLYNSLRLFFLFLVNTNPPTDCSWSCTCGKMTGWANSRKFNKPAWLSFRWALQHLPICVMKPFPKWGGIIPCSSLCAFLCMDKGMRTTASVLGSGERAS